MRWVFVLLLLLLCSSCSFSFSRSVGGILNPFGAINDVIDSGGFTGGFVKGVTNPVGAVNDLSNLAQGKKTGLTQASPETQCKIKCGDCSGLESDPPRMQWCSVTSKEKFGSPCCSG